MICPICKIELIKDGKRYRCINNHSFDISKDGYTNLYLNNTNSGDNKEMINARYNIMIQGCFEKLALELINIIKELNIKKVLDAGSGEGYYTRMISNNLDVVTYGVDISKNACLKASKLNNKVKYFVSSIYDLPFSDNEVDLIINIFAPHCEKEFFRVTSKYLLIVVPSYNHLIELKEILYENVYLNKEAKLDFSTFNLVKEESLTYKYKVNNLIDLVQMTPYFYTTKDIELNINELDVTFDFKILLFEKID